ncbi:dienelactone hydrolase family protein [Ammoniphilus sp. CFH 90114]|uniref:dienelactone hydrolase family protein n=1 Tax=Ammoniphilus sp. CFH 90114 TaxID=2493665 RepID=UPI0013E94043|nr:dienelactone hydrolase family protein [Ammoniphilus sp. CFH 90114]
MKSSELDVNVIQVNYENENTLFSSVLCQPEAMGKLPAIVTIHGIFGLQEMDINFARRLASLGYVVLAHGWQSKEKDPSDQDIVEGIRQAIEFFKENERVDYNRLGLIGICRGGSIAMLSGANIEELKVSVSFYGQAYYPVLDHKKPVSPIDLADKVKIPMLFVHGEQDSIFDAQESVDMCRALQVRGQIAEYKLYPEPGHGFFLKGHRNYHEQASEDAWIILSKFLQGNL